MAFPTLKLFRSIFDLTGAHLLSQRFLSHIHVFFTFWHILTIWLKKGWANDQQNWSELINPPPVDHQLGPGTSGHPTRWSVHTSPAWRWRCHRYAAWSPWPKHNGEAVTGGHPPVLRIAKMSKNTRKASILHQPTRGKKDGKKGSLDNMWCGCFGEKMQKRLAGESCNYSRIQRPSEPWKDLIICASLNGFQPRATCQIFTLGWDEMPMDQTRNTPKMMISVYWCSRAHIGHLWLSPIPNPIIQGSAMGKSKSSCRSVHPSPKTKGCSARLIGM